MSAIAGDVEEKCLNGDGDEYNRRWGAGLLEEIIGVEKDEARGIVEMGRMAARLYGLEREMPQQRPSAGLMALARLNAGLSIFFPGIRGEGAALREGMQRAI